jgi:lysophospholipase L1-like esterase
MKTNLRGLLINLSLVLFSTLVALVLSEIVLRLMGSVPLYVSPERDRFWKYDSLLGWSHEPGQRGVFETSEFRTIVRINENGLRDRLHSYERQDESSRILILGDSFAWGYGVKDGERFSERLEDAFGFEVINAGVSGYSTDQELLWYQNEGIKYETDLVILVLAGNDVGDNERQLVSTIYYKPRFILQDGELVLIGTPVPQTSPQGKFIYSLSQRSALVYFLVQRYFDLRSVYAKMKDTSDRSSSQTAIDTKAEPFELTVALLEEIRNIAESKNARFMIVTTESWWNYRSDETYDDLLTTLQKHGFLVLDVESMPGFDPEKMIIPNDGHWNSSGNEFVAKEIQALIESERLLNQP